MSGGMKFKTRLAGGAAFAALMFGGVAAQAAEPVKFDIAPQPLTAALNEFGVQSNHAVLFTTDLTNTKVTHGVSKEADPEIALAEMLDGTGLSFRRSGDAFLIVSASDPQSGSAAGDGADGTVQALIVTAQKREENIQDVPIAMSAFTQEDLTKSQVTGGPDLMTQVPNFTFTKTNFSGYSIQIRGIGTQAISATTDAAVAVAENNTPFIRNRFFEQEFYDLQRVEVLRGPQGTLYGRNATAGVVNIITAKPSFHYEAKLSADVGNYNSTRFEGMVNVPLVDDKVALRLAGAWTKRDGYDTNQITGNRIDGRDLWSTRLTLRFEPTDSIRANLIWEHFNEDDDRLRSGKQLCHTDVVSSVGGIPTPNFYQTLAEIGQPALFMGVQATFSQGCKPASLYAPESFETPNGLSLPYYGPLQIIGLPIVSGGTTAYIDPYISRTQSNDLRVIESTVDPKYTAETDTVELQMAFDLRNGLTLTSETGYNSDDLFSVEDYNRFSTSPGIFRDSVDGTGNFRRNGVLNDGFFCDPQVGCANRLVAVDLSTAKSRQFSQEFRLSSDFDGPLNFSLGANFLRYDTEDKYYVFINTIGAYAALSPYKAGGMGGGRGPMPPYVANQSDNSECLKFGQRPPNFGSVEVLEGCMYMDPNPIGSLNDQGHNYFLSKNPFKLISYAAFGEAYYQLTPNLKLTGGLRWTIDKKEAPRIPSWLLAADTTGYPVIETVRQRWSEPTGRLALDWKPDLSFTDETLLYASYAHGYKAGGANPPPAGIVLTPGILFNYRSLNTTSVTHPKTFGPEFVNAFELGSKNTLLDGKLTLNGDAFYYDYTGYQISQIVDRSAVNMNFDAKVWGLELESDWRPVENLRLGLKLGYERTRVADGAKAIDVMDRTAGHSDWVVVSPFPTYPSNCVLPAWLFVGSNEMTSSGFNLVNLGGPGGGNPGGCEYAYTLGYDPATGLPYTPNPYNDPALSTQDHIRASQRFRTGIDYMGWNSDISHYPGWPSSVPFGSGAYPGWDPNVDYGNNHGEGFFKDLSGKELPNAPHITATLTADYTLPLPNSWLMTLHTDFYYQSEAWARIFNTPGYDKLKAYNNVNFAAIFTNDDAGWKVMAYVKNVFDKANITGAFLNSDDTGLTTNVFLNEPRLYGLRVTKEWTGGPWWTGANPNHTGPYPLTIELGGEVQHQEAPFSAAAPELSTGLPSGLMLPNIQNRPLNWGDGRSVKIVYQVTGSPWSLSAAYRYGRANSGTTRTRADIIGARQCAFPTTGAYQYAGHAFCDPTYSLFGGPPGHYYDRAQLLTPDSWSEASSRNHEEHTIVDFDVGREVGLGAPFADSVVSAGIRYADFQSTSDFTTAAGLEYIPDAWRFKYGTEQRYRAHFAADRQFKGAGPVVSWAAAAHLAGTEETGRLNVDWSASAGVAFGKQKTSSSHEETAAHYSVFGQRYWPLPPDYSSQPISREIHRSKSVSVPVVDLSLGLSYDIQRIKVSTGYRWERYFNVLDAGYAEHKSYDRTLDGPYFKIAVGFGG